MQCLKSTKDSQNALRTVLHLKAFLWRCLPSSQESRECSGLLTGLFTGGIPVLNHFEITPACYGRLGDDTIVSCEDKIQVGTSILPLICWQGQGDGNKRSSCWDPKDRSCHSKESWLNHFELIYKFVLPLKSKAKPKQTNKQKPFEWNFLHSSSLVILQALCRIFGLLREHHCMTSSW